MTITPYPLYLYSSLAAAILLLAISLRRIAGQKSIKFVAAAAVVGAMLFSAEHVPIYATAMLVIGILNFNGMLSAEKPRRRIFYVATSTLYIAIIHWIGFVAIAQAMLLGILSSITKIKEYRNSVEDKKVEVRRDLFHIGAGILLMAVFLIFEEPVAVTIQLLMILGGIFVIAATEIFNKNAIGRSIYRFERNGASLGHGALWLAMGSLFAVSFLSTPNVIAVFAAIFIGDPVATIAGIYSKGPKLPYNRKKSVVGTAAYFIVASAIAFIFIGAAGVLVGLVGAIVEGLKTKIDDNFSVSVVLTLLLAIMRA